MAQRRPDADDEGIAPDALDRLRAAAEDEGDGEDEKPNTPPPRQQIDASDTVQKARKQADPFDEFEGWVKENVRRFMSVAAKLVRYVDHWEGTGPDGEPRTVSVERFLHAANLAVLDLFTTMDDNLKIYRLRLREPEALAEIRSDPAFAAIKSDIAEKLRALRDGEGLEVFAKFFESAAAFETAKRMFFAKTDRDRGIATAEFLDRIAPKQSRKDGPGTVVVVFPPGQAEAMEKTMQIMGDRWNPDPLISAKQVRVPALPAHEEET